MSSGAVRNWCIARGALPANVMVVVFTVPADNTLILKNVRLFLNQQVTTPSFNTLLQTASGAAVPVAWNTPIPAAGFISLEFWSVLNAGDQLAMSCTGASHYWCSGALLPLAVGQVPPIQAAEIVEWPAWDTSVSRRPTAP